MRSKPKLIALACAASITVAVALVASAGAAVVPKKFVLAFNVGKNVNKTKQLAGEPQEERNECTVASKDECQPALEEGTEPRGFSFPESVAVNSTNGSVYIADKVNHRVQELDSAGRFVLMFGAKVNKASNGDVCLAGEECQAGEAAVGGPGEILGGQDVAVDSLTGNVYVLEVRRQRVEEFTADGEFVLMLGGKVNKTTGANVCTAEEIKSLAVECQAGTEGGGPGEFQQLVGTGYGNAIYVGPQDHLLYVADEARVQKFETDGKWAGQISTGGLSPTGVVTAVSVDREGNVFVSDSAVAGVHVYDSGGTLAACVIDEASTTVHGLAMDAYERLAVLEWTPNEALLYKAKGPQCGEEVNPIAPPDREMRSSPRGLAFSAHLDQKGDPEDELYVAIAGGVHEIEAYAPVLFPEVKTCATETVTTTTAVLCGEINPNDLTASGLFKFGTSEGLLASETPVAFGPIAQGSWTRFGFELTGLLPNQDYYDEAFVQATIEGVVQTQGGPPPFHFHTKTPSPDLIGKPFASFVTDRTAVLNDVINPEHALTHYHFEYAACETEAQDIAECGEIETTPDLQSAQFGPIGVVQGIQGLKSDTAYAFRLVASNAFQYEGESEGGVAVDAEEGHFSTGPLPVPLARTASPSGITQTAATLSGFVAPNGETAVYEFELGVDTGAATRYVPVYSEVVYAAEPEMERKFTVSGLQPNTAYSYRIRVDNGYGVAIGEPVSFTTGGFLEGVPPQRPAIFPMPIGMRFPVFPKCRRGWMLDKRQKCVKRHRRRHGHNTHTHRGKRRGH